jgi:hypothetical protein
MDLLRKIQWVLYDLIFGVFFGVQRWFWFVVLKILLPDCKTLIDPLIKAKEGSDEPKKALDEIYRFLGILDTKASALMRYNGIILAVIALMVRQRQDMPDIMYYIVLLTIASILACLLVVGIFWRFLEWVNPDGANVEEKLGRELDMIRRVLILREVAYQLAWWASAAVLFMLAAHLTDFVSPTARPGVAPATTG